MRRMSFSMTEQQFRDGTKDVTRRLGWWDLKPGDHFLAIRKGRGLKKGEKQVVLGEAVVVSTRPEDLDEITKADCVREGFPELSPTEFVTMFRKHMRYQPFTIVNRIEFKHVEKEASDGD